MVTHDTRLIDYCDRVLIMKDGILKEKYSKGNCSLSHCLPITAPVLKQVTLNSISRWLNMYDNILDVAEKLFMQQGYQATSTRQIADTLGITQPNLYYYFKKKKKFITMSCSAWPQRYLQI